MGVKKVKAAKVTCKVNQGHWQMVPFDRPHSIFCHCSTATMSQKIKEVT